jgi:hypothetical protein
MTFVFAGIGLSTTAAADDMVKQAASDFEVPSFTSRQIAIEGQDLLAIAGTPDGTVADGQLAITYTKVEQTPERTLTIGESATIYGTTGGSHAMSFAAEGVGAVSTQRFLYGSRGLGLTGSVAAGTAKIAQSEAIADLYLGGGASYGRIVDARTLAQAQTMFSVLDREPSVEEVVAVAELIGQRAAYTAEYQYDADIYFYNDVAEALGGASLEEVYKIQQVLDSPLYNIGSRVTGWTAGARLDIGSGDLLGENGMASSLSQYAAYATLVGNGASLTLSETLSRGLSDSGANQQLTPPITTEAGSTALVLAAALSVDHSSSWNSGAALTITAKGGLPLEEDGTGGQETTWAASAQSNLAVGSKMVAGGEFSSGKTLGEDDLNWGLNFRITYYVL